jgi:hypothetical protein
MYRIHEGDRRYRRWMGEGGWEKVTSPCCGAYQIGHLARVEDIEGCVRQLLPGLALAGGAYGGVGIADCVRSGEDAAVRLLEAAISSRG